MRLLVREDVIDLSGESTSIGEIYIRMVRCLYKRFTVQKGINFEIRSFVQILKSLGKIALDTLLSAKSLIQRSDVIKEVGDDAFDYGMPIGHEDAHRSIRDETADLFVTFIHRSIQEFLGAFFFVLRIDKIESLQGLKDFALEFLTNPSFFQFCLWFLENSEQLSPLRNKEKVYDLLVACGRKQIDDVSIGLKNISSMFPELGTGLVKTNDSAMKILCDVDSERLSSRSSFQLKDEFRDISEP